MVVYNYSGKEINAKIVYYGPALSGKTTNLEWIYSKIPLEYSGKMISLRTQTDRTIFFDFLPLELGLIDGFKTRFMLYTVPGQVYYNATRKMVLKGVDGVVFVADSEEGRLADNLESFQNLRENLEEIGLDPDSIPLVMQWNKRDLSNCMEVELLEKELNAMGAPSFEGCALTGQGVYETLHQISRMIYLKLTSGEELAGSVERSGSAIDETSLFGEDIAHRLQDVDNSANDPTLTESVGLDPSEQLLSSDDDQEGAVLDAILGQVSKSQGESSDTAAEVPQEQGRTTAEGEAGEAVASAAAASPGEGSREEVMAAAGTAPTAAIPNHDSVSGQDSAMAASLSDHKHSRGSAPMTDQPQTPGPGASQATPPHSAPDGHDPSATTAGEPVDETVSDLVDNVFSELPGGGVEHHSAGVAPVQNSQKLKPLEDEAAADDLAYGNSFGRMVDLAGGQGEGADPNAGTAASGSGGFELPEDLLNSGSGPTLPATGPTAPVEEEPLELITDPLKSPSEASDSGQLRVDSEIETGGIAPLGGSFSSSPAGVRTIEVPVTIDADALVDGKTIRVVLNLQVKR